VTPGPGFRPIADTTLDPNRGEYPPEPTVWPTLSVIMPVRNEAPHLAEAVESVLAQHYPTPIELVLAVAPSSDDTMTIARRLARVDRSLVVIGNPTGRTPAGLNLAIEASSGQVIARVDAHSQLTPGYLRRATATLLDTGADNVGGIQRAVGATSFERSVAIAMTSRMGVGDAKFHYGGRPGPTDTVYLGVFDRSALERVGGYDESLLRNQDYELNWRLRSSGGTVWFDPELEVAYRPRGSFRALTRQYHDYGRFKRTMLQANPRSAKLRQLIPPLTLAGVGAGLGLAASGRRWGLMAPLVYLAGLLSATLANGRSHLARPEPPAGESSDQVSPSAGALVEVARLPAVFAIMHGAWATGFFRGAPSD